ncbi:MAG: glycosyltransferase family 1 protein [Myxococcales bacterium]|nr:glycosyltransferase family 1 protein [Myxococcales bacterium]
MTDDELASHDHVFVASTHYARRLAARLPGAPVEPLLQAYDAARFFPDPSAGANGHDVLFVGNSRTVPRPIVADAVRAKLPLAIYGGKWERFVPAKHLRGAYVDNVNLRLQYSSAKVVLNDHWPDMRREGFLSNRLFEAAACGACVITDPVLGLEEIFGGSVLHYLDTADLARLVRGLLADEARRRSLGEAARRAVERHTFDERARVLERIIRKMS